MNDDHSSIDTHELDRQIRAVLRVEPSADQIARLQRFWRQKSVTESRRRLLHWTAAAALIAATLSISLLRRDAIPRPAEPACMARAVTSSPRPTHPALDRPVAPAESVSEEIPHSAGRPPTAYERFVFTARAVQAARESRSSGIAAVDGLVEQLAGNPQTDARQLLKQCDLQRSDAEQLLLWRWLHSSDEPRRAVVRLLAVCSTTRSIAQFLRLSERAELRDDALGAIEQIAGVSGLAHAASQSADRNVRAGIFRRLFTADTEPALRAYLSLVQEDATRGEALAVADAASDRCLAMLLDRLGDEEKAVRLSAALVLGRVNGPEVTRSLIALVTRDSKSPAEAWIALTACRGQQVEQFFAYAMSDPQLLGHVNRARLWWVRMML